MVPNYLPMSALGQKQTFRNAIDMMSALPPKADMCSATRDVCFGPKADIVFFHNFQTQRGRLSALRYFFSQIRQTNIGPAALPKVRPKRRPPRLIPAASVVLG